jgi:hypothetical protein
MTLIPDATPPHSTTLMLSPYQEEKRVKFVNAINEINITQT